jgi:hypothetical protein
MTKRRIPRANLCVYHVLPHVLHNAPINKIINWGCAWNRHEVRLCVCVRIFIGDTSPQHFFTVGIKGFSIPYRFTPTFSEQSANNQGTFDIVANLLGEGLGCRKLISPRPNSIDPAFFRNSLDSELPSIFCLAHARSRVCTTFAQAFSFSQQALG